MSHHAFELLARPIQRILWDMRWRELRPIQVEAIHHVLEEQCDLIVSARTASGKTEAAFLPILSRIYECPQPSVQAVYVGPLKALINDQFRRLEDLCVRAEIAVYRWHGDVDIGKKNALLDQPSGVLLITPESIESLFVNRSTFLSRVFAHLDFVVIDELHAFVGRERGTHLRSLLFRLERLIGKESRMVALSATLGDALPIYADWMRPGRIERVHHIHGQTEQKQVLYGIQCFTAQPIDPPETADTPDPDIAAQGSELPVEIIADLHRSFAGRTNLIFANAKEDVESFADSLNDYAKQQGLRPEFLVHHGSLSKQVREHTEQLMHGNQPHTTVCSSTLELGIDIGSVTSVGQIGPPWSVSSLVQRLGRSGRGEGEPQVMRVYVMEREADARSRIVDCLYPGLLRAIAATELMLQKWIEPPYVDELDLSTLVQQILSALAQTGGTQAASLFEQLVAKGAFQKIPMPLFASLLRSLAANELIEQIPGGDLILAPEGERLVHHYDFYSAFATAIEYAVVSYGMPIGRLPARAIPNEHDHLLLAGRRWEVIRVDHEKAEILVVPAHGRKPPRFLGAVGDIHPRIRQTMRQVLLGDASYPYLDDTASRLLTSARRTAVEAGLAHKSLIALGDDACLWFTWTGTKVQRTLCLMCECLGLEAVDQGIAIEFSAGINEITDNLGNALIRKPDPIQLAQKIPGKWLRKFDSYISERLLVESLARDAIDVFEAISVIGTLLEDHRDVGR